MNREEQIKHKASSIRDKMISNDASVGYALGYEDGYVDGALYSDENPKEGLVNLDKACKILKEHISEYTTIKTHGSYGENFSREIVMTDNGIEKFRKDMEE